MTMENAGHFQSQLTSLMNAVVTAAVVEIVRLVEDSAVVLRQQLSKSKLENEALKVENESNKKKLQILEGKSMAAKQRSVARHEADGRKCNSCGWLETKLIAFALLHDLFFWQIIKHVFYGFFC